MNPRKLYVIGDSISMHYGPYLERYVSGSYRYARKSPEDVAALGLSDSQDANGADSRAVRIFLEAMLASGRLDADILLVNCGLHDIKRNRETDAYQVPIGEYSENLRAVTAACAARGLPLVWMRTTPCDEAVHNVKQSTFHRFAADCSAYNAAADAVMEKAGVPSIDLHGFTLSMGGDLYCDHVHFHEHIREKQAAYIAGWLAGWETAAENH